MARSKKTVATRHVALQALPANETISSTATPSKIFLAGPPGSGKTALGQRACRDLGLRFLDLPGRSTSSGDAALTIKAVVNDESADVVTLPWELQQDAATFTECRRAGVVVALWAHPLEMQARSGHATPLFTPVGRLTTHGGFGRSGTGCREFRRLNRACDDVLMLGGRTLDEALEDLKDLIEDLRMSKPDASEREGLGRWIDDWVSDFKANREACEVLVDAMARYTLHLKERGAAPRRMSGVYTDLNSAGMLVMMYETPKGTTVLGKFSSAPWTGEFKRKFSDSPGAVARYASTLKGFAAFLREAGMIASE